MRAKCSGECGKMIDPNGRGVHREVTGWERVRAGGGANAIELRTVTGRVMCQMCFSDLKHGGKTEPMFA